jgi:hypothetical protein
LLTKRTATKQGAHCEIRETLEQQEVLILGVIMPKKLPIPFRPEEEMFEALHEIVDETPTEGFFRDSEASIPVAVS